MRIVWFAGLPEQGIKVFKSDGGKNPGPPPGLFPNKKEGDRFFLQRNTARKGNWTKKWPKFGQKMAKKFVPINSFWPHQRLFNEIPCGKKKIGLSRNF